MSEEEETPTGPADAAERIVERGSSIGRFLVVGVLGTGGMGVVLSAYDPQLDRRVALKLLRRGFLPDATQNLLGEAKAMARLQHPNVLTVHEVGFAEDTGYVVMEEVEGQTLRAWLDEAKRGWSEVLELMIAAGAGLAAAHEAGIIHRDFKPDNVLVGRDGRPRVSDFGLAAMTLGPGAVAGTRGYMPPEQASGGTIDARADQFAFCVTLWEALHGELPSPDGTVPRTRRAPGWVYRALLRGLRADPDARWPSMADLLAALRRRPSRWVFGAAAVATLALAGVLLVGRTRSSEPPPCAGAAALIAPVWDDAARAQVTAAFRATGRPYADESFARVDASLRSHQDAWVRGHDDACLATAVRHDQSDALLDLRMGCLAHARAEMAALVSLLGHADVTALDRAGQAAADVGDVEGCADATALTAAAPLPRDPEKRRAIEALRDDAARLPALYELGDRKGGAAAGRELLPRARAIGYAPVLASVLYELGRIDQGAGDVDSAIPELYEAARVGAAARLDDLVALAVGELVYLLGYDKNSFEAAEVAYQIGLAAAARTSNPSKVLASLMHQRAWVLFGKGDEWGALALRQLALLTDASLYGVASHQTAEALGEVAGSVDVVGNAEAAGPLFERAIAIDETALGAAHPNVVSLLNNYGADRVDAYDYDKATTLFERVLAAREASFGADSPRVGIAMISLAAARLGQRHVAEAGALAEHALSILEGPSGPDDPHVLRGQMMLAFIDQLEGKLAEAHQLFQRVNERRRKSGARLDLGEGLLGDAGVLLDLGDLKGARSAVEQAAAVELEVLGPNNPGIANSVSVLGDVLRGEKKFARAVQVYRQALALWQEQVGADSPVLVETLTGLCEALLATGDGAGAREAAERAVHLSRLAPADERDGAEFCLAKSEWLTPAERPGALALARDARAELAALAYPARDLPRIDRWLAEASRPR